MRLAKTIVLVYAFLLACYPVRSQKAGLKISNQISSWLGVSFEDPVPWQIGARYIPNINPSINLN